MNPTTRNVTDISHHGVTGAKTLTSATKPRHQRTVRSCVALFTLFAVSILGLGEAGADESGARTSVRGRGDIITSILQQTNRRSSSNRPPSCFWKTVTDAELEFLVEMSMMYARDGAHNKLLPELERLAESPDIGNADLRLRVCNGDVVEVVMVPRATDLSSVELLSRQMITRLPPTQSQFQPVITRPVAPNTPIFVSIPPSNWRPIHNVLEVGGITAEVRAVPRTIRVFTGEPGATDLECAGPGVAYATNVATPPKVQAQQPHACTFEYRFGTNRSSVRWSPLLFQFQDHWFGTVSVVWDVDWRAQGGEWQSLGLIPRTQLFSRVVSESGSAITRNR